MISEAEERKTAEYLRKRGYGVISPDQYQIDIEAEFREVWERVRPFTMTSLERGYALYQSVRYVCAHRIPGDFVECGVWKGGSCMLIALLLQELGETDRSIYLYDTYCGMTEPCELDRIAWNGRAVRERWDADRKGIGNYFTGWAVAADEVRDNMRSVGWPAPRMHLVEGDVCATLRETRPQRAALVRLDTDWYQSTVCELEMLYPVLSAGGVLLVDDYGHFEGARKAVDDYLADPNRIMLLNRVDYTGRVGVKVA